LLCPQFEPRLCPQRLLLARQAHEIFERHTDLIEPLSVDEAYRDVSENKTGSLPAAQVATHDSANKPGQNWSLTARQA